MKAYITQVFTYFGCGIQQEKNILIVTLTPEFARYFGKPELRLVFHPDHLEEHTEFVTYGSYLVNRLYDLLKRCGQKVAITLPARDERTRDNAVDVEESLLPYRCSLKSRRVRAVLRTETFLTFRLTYHSTEKCEELLTTGTDVEGNLREHTEFPYSREVLQESENSRFPLTNKEARAIYETCLHHVHHHAETRAKRYQETLAEHYHHDIARLEGYYQQQVEEIPDLAKNREQTIRQLRHEYEIKTAEELQKCHVEVMLTPVSFCAVNIPFQRRRYRLESRRRAGRQPHNVVIDVFQNECTGEMMYPACDSCGKAMQEVGICDAHTHPVCRDCLKQCEHCHAHVCLDCGIEPCAECGAWVCPACSTVCHLCGRRFCHEHLLGCLRCHDHFCPHCAVPCERCGAVTGVFHLSECDISHTQVCLNCLALCSCCDKNVSREHITSCAFCGQRACSDCTFTCDVCGSQFCVHHVTECDISGKMTCPRHSGVCQHCGRHISTRYLHTCDICGKKICAHCAMQCQDCGHFFCPDDADEMTPCPECGKFYCSLCYSGQGVCDVCQEAGAMLLT